MPCVSGLQPFITNKSFFQLFITALHGIQTRSSGENSVCPSVRVSNAWIVTKRTKSLSRFFIWYAVVSPGLVSPGAATDGVTLFFLKTLTTFLVITTVSQSVLYCDPYFLLKKLTTLFSYHCHFYWFHLGVTPCRVSPWTFLPVRPRLSTVLCKFSHKIVFFHPGFTRLEGVTRGGPRPPPVPLVKPLSIRKIV